MNHHNYYQLELGHDTVHMVALYLAGYLRNKLQQYTV